MGKILRVDINLNSNCPKTKQKIMAIILVFSSHFQQKKLLRKIRVNTNASCVVERIRNVLQWNPNESERSGILT